MSSLPSNLVVTCSVRKLSDGAEHTYHPIEGILVSLSNSDNPQYRFNAITDGKGRISKWIFVGKHSHGPCCNLWRLRFETCLTLPNLPFPHVDVSITGHEPSHHNVTVYFSKDNYMVSNNVSQLRATIPRSRIAARRNLARDPAHLYIPPLSGNSIVISRTDLSTQSPQDPAQRPVSTTSAYVSSPSEPSSSIPESRPHTLTSLSDEPGTPERPAKRRKSGLTG